MGGLKLAIFNLCTSCLLRALIRKLNSLSLLNVRPISAPEQLLEYADKNAALKSHLLCQDLCAGSACPCIVHVSGLLFDV